MSAKCAYIEYLTASCKSGVDQSMLSHVTSLQYAVWIIPTVPPAWLPATRQTVSLSLCVREGDYGFIDSTHTAGALISHLCLIRESKNCRMNLAGHQNKTTDSEQNETCVILERRNKDCPSSFLLPHHFGPLPVKHCCQFNCFPHKAVSCLMFVSLCVWEETVEAWNLLKEEDSLQTQGLSTKPFPFHFVIHNLILWIWKPSWVIVCSEENAAYAFDLHVT